MALLHHAKPRKPHSSRAPSLPVVLAVAAVLLAVLSLAFALLRSPQVVTVFRCGRAVDTVRTFRARSGAEVEARGRVLGFVGVSTGLNGRERRRAVRESWFAKDPEGLRSLEHATGLAFRFVIGKTKDAEKMRELKREEEIHHDFMFIDADEDHVKHPFKTLALFKAAFDLFQADFYVKMDDNVYLRPDRLATVLAKERANPLTYIGCMKHGPVVTDPASKWYEDQGDLIGNDYFLHAFGPIYALSSEVVLALSNAKVESLRFFNNEDVTIGSWMLAMNVTYEDNKATCHPKCTTTSIAVWDIPKCSGLCNPVTQLKELHNNTMCSKSPTIPPEDIE